MNFVFGTTGGDRDALMKVTQESGVYAVIEAWTTKRVLEGLEMCNDLLSGWWFQIFFIFIPLWGNDPI